MKLYTINRDNSSSLFIPTEIDNRFLLELCSVLHGRLLETTTKPDTKPATRPNTRPSPRPRREPFRPLKPKVNPKPKAVHETFERSVNPGINSFWSNVRQGDHPFAKHPLMAMYGKEKAQKSWQKGIASLKKAFPELAEMDNPTAQKAAPQMAMRAMRSVMQAERPHQEALKKIALEIVNEVWGFPVEMMEANFSTQPGMDEPDHGEPPSPEDIERLRDQINKRITMNALTQGAAVQNMATIHHIAEKKISALAPELMQFYDQFASSAVSYYWVLDFARMAGLSGAAIGTTEVDFDGESPIVKAQAMVFPVLIQELVKGVMEVLSAHGLEDLDEHDTGVVYSQADRLEDEPWLIQVGPHLWDAFLQIIPRGSSLADIVANLAAKEPQFIHDLLAQTIEAVHGATDPAEQREILSQMMEEVKQAEDQISGPNDDPDDSPEEQWDVGEPTY